MKSQTSFWKLPLSKHAVTSSVNEETEISNPLYSEILNPNAEIKNRKFKRLVSEKSYNAAGNVHPPSSPTNNQKNRNKNFKRIDELTENFILSYRTEQEVFVS